MLLIWLCWQPPSTLVGTLPLETVIKNGGEERWECSGPACNVEAGNELLRSFSQNFLLLRTCSLSGLLSTNLLSSSGHFLLRRLPPPPQDFSPLPPYFFFLPDVSLHWRPVSSFRLPSSSKNSGIEENEFSLLRGQTVTQFSVRLEDIHPMTPGRRTGPGRS